MAANSIEKSLETISGDPTLEKTDIQIEIEDPEKVSIITDEMSLVMEADEKEDGFNENLAEAMDESVLATVSEDLLSDFDDDISSRKDWMQTYVDGLDLLGLQLEERTEPWPGACGVHHPLLTEALVKFQSETIMGNVSSTRSSKNTDNR